MAVFSSWRNEIELSEVLTDNLDSKKDKKITGEGVNNKKLIKVFPDDSSDVKEQTTVDGSPVTPDDKQSDRKEKQLKKRLLRLKLTGISQGHGADITTSYEPDGKLVEGEDWKPEIEHSKLGDAVKKKDEKKRKEAESSLPPHLKLDVMKKAFAHTNEAYRVLARDKGDKGKPSQFSYKDEKDANKFADSIKSKGGKATVAKEEAYDTYKDKHLEKYGSRPGEYDRPRPSTGGGKHSGNDKMTKRKNSDKAVDNVVADLKKKYGENAVLHSKRSYVAGKRVK